MSDDNIVRGHFSHFRQPPQPERKAKEEAALGEHLNDRMAMWLVDSELKVGLDHTRNMLMAAQRWVENRLIYKKGTWL